MPLICVLGPGSRRFLRSTEDMSRRSARRALNGICGFIEDVSVPVLLRLGWVVVELLCTPDAERLGPTPLGGTTILFSVIEGRADCSEYATACVGDDCGISVDLRFR